ncbi:MAG: glycosyltransferase family 39 protein [bacterium]|nr:glycosyltransferase family 39 protein [bacterium]
MGRLDKRIIAIFLIAIAVRLAFFVAFAWHEETFNLTLGPQDTAGFINDAKNLFSGHGFSDRGMPPFDPDGIRVPLVPVILGLFGANFGLYVIFQILVASFSAVLVSLVGREVFGAKAGFVAALLLAIDPFSAYHSIVILSETWFTFLVMAALYCLARFFRSAPGRVLTDWRWLVAGGIVGGLVALTRPTGMVIAGVLALILFLNFNLSFRRRLLWGMIFILLAAAVVSPWLWRNHDRFGVAGLSYIPAYNWYYFNARVFYARKHNIGNAQAESLFRSWEREEQKINGEKNGFAMQPFYLQKTWEVISPYWPQYLVFHGLNTAAVFLGSSFDDIQKGWTKSSNDVNLTSLLLQGPKGWLEVAKDYPQLLAAKVTGALLYFFVLLNIAFAAKARRQVFWLAVLSALALALALTTGAAAEPRFRVPVQPLVLLLFGFSWYQTMDYLKSKNQKATVKL